MTDQRRVINGVEHWSISVVHAPTVRSFYDRLGPATYTLECIFVRPEIAVVFRAFHKIDSTLKAEKLISVNDELRDAMMVTYASLHGTNEVEARKAVRELLADAMRRAGMELRRSQKRRRKS